MLLLAALDNIDIADNKIVSMCDLQHTIISIAGHLDLPSVVTIRHNRQVVTSQLLLSVMNNRIISCCVVSDFSFCFIFYMSALVSIMWVLTQEG